MTRRYEDMDVDEWVNMLMRVGDFQAPRNLEAMATQYGKEQAERKEKASAFIPLDAAGLKKAALWIVIPSIIGAIIAGCSPLWGNDEMSASRLALTGAIVSALIPLVVMLVVDIPNMALSLLFCVTGRDVTLFKKSKSKLAEVEVRSSKEARDHMFRDLETAMPIYRQRVAERNAQRKAEEEQRIKKEAEAKVQAEREAAEVKAEAERQEKERQRQKRKADHKAQYKEDLRKKRRGE
ncbi:hypothetical protein [Corynebacterium terpenotabidum]|uniref:Uncharacterized protein n=1 Tax=Corynebacterium terpenotabidum Y-11 TaxID=1200352 RepID=S4XEQ9_9CORY|nr:hypothetical protein [Corynebacterium terpenotabidum]AGP30095.1 hypothetical protein A606_02210 [Corynebacterium terpenotabidum Y-11]